MDVKRYPKIILVVAAILVLASCGRTGSAAQSQVVPTSTPIPSTVTPQPTATPLYVFSSNPNLGSGWEGDYEETGVAIGVEKTYSHFPQSYIIYDEVIVNDELLGVAFVCYDQPYDVTDIFALLSEPGEQPARYKSWDIQQRDGCHVEFTVKNTSGDTMGLTFTSHCPICLE